MGGAGFLKPSSVWMCANKKWHELTWISNKLLVSWWKKIQTCKLFTTEKQHSSHAFLSFPSLPTQLGSKAYDGHFEEVGQIQEAGYTEVLWWAARFLGEARPEKNNPSTWENPPRFWLPFNLPGKPCYKVRPKSRSFIDARLREVENHQTITNKMGPRHRSK